MIDKTSELKLIKCNPDRRWHPLQANQLVAAKDIGTTGKTYCAGRERMQ